MLTGLATGVAALIGVRFLFGLAEAGVFPQATRALHNWTQPRERGVALGFLNMGSRLGAAFGLAITPLSVERLGWRQTFVLLGIIGVIWAVIHDQRYRCRTCLRRLRMPILTGNWTHILLGRPRTEYICPFGHGTLTVDEVQITGHLVPDWEPHEDMWKELVSLEDSKK